MTEEGLRVKLTWGGNVTSMYRCIHLLMNKCVSLYNPQYNSTCLRTTCQYVWELQYCPRKYDNLYLKTLRWQDNHPGQVLRDSLLLGQLPHRTTGRKDKYPSATDP